MSRWIRGTAVALVLLWPLTASAFGHRHRTTTAAYFYPVTVVAPAPVVVPVVAARVTFYTPVYVAVPACPPVVEVPVTAGFAVPAAPAAPVPVTPPADPYAVPVPAPPSQTPALPFTPMDRPPEATEARTFGGVYPVRREVPLAPDRARVGFTNLTRRDVVLRINGQPQVLPSGRAVNLNLPRQFVWQIDQREPQGERVPSDRNSVDIVIRR
jgi:hypothetical protein